MAAPMPLEAPVTTATFPVSLLMVFFSGYLRFGVPAVNASSEGIERATVTAAAVQALSAIQREARSIAACDERDWW